MVCVMRAFSILCRVWSWGWGVHGQLGLRTVEDKVTPTHSNLLDNMKVSYIAAGSGHSAILTCEVRGHPQWVCVCVSIHPLLISSSLFSRAKSTRLEMVCVYECVHMCVCVSVCVGV